MDVRRPTLEWLRLADEISRRVGVRKCATEFWGLWGDVIYTDKLSDPDPLHNIYEFTVHHTFLLPCPLFPVFYIRPSMLTSSAWCRVRREEDVAHRGEFTGMRNKPSVSLSYVQCEKPAGITGTETITRPLKLTQQFSYQDKKNNRHRPHSTAPWVLELLATGYVQDQASHWDFYHGHGT